MDPFQLTLDAATCHTAPSPGTPALGAVLQSYGWGGLFTGAERPPEDVALHLFDVVYDGTLSRADQPALAARARAVAAAVFTPATGALDITVGSMLLVHATGIRGALAIDLMRADASRRDFLYGVLLPTLRACAVEKESKVSAVEYHVRQAAPRPFVDGPPTDADNAQRAAAVHEMRAGVDVYTYAVDSALVVPATSAVLAVPALAVREMRFGAPS